MSSSEVREPRTYEFGPTEQRGVIGDVRRGQFAILVIGAALSIGVLSQLASALGALLALGVGGGTLAIAFVPVRGRGFDEWAPVAVRFVLARVRGSLSWRSRAASDGLRVSGDAAIQAAEWELPAELDGVEMLAAPLRGSEVAVFKDTREGTYTAVLAIHVPDFGLLDGAGQERRLERWGNALAGMAREGSPVSRVMWIERTVPSDGDELARYTHEARDPAVPLGAASMQSYLELLDGAGSAGQEHEVLVALQIKPTGARRAVKRAGGGDEGACAVLLRELSNLADGLTRADLVVRGALRPGIAAKSLRLAYDPFLRARLARMEAAERREDPDAARDGLPPGQLGPTATEETWRTYRTDGAVHASYWIAGWPRMQVRAAFFAPMMLHSGVVRTVAMILEPRSPQRAIAEAEAELTGHLADEQLRASKGFMTMSRGRRKQEAVMRREGELSFGHAEMRFAGFVTVSAPSEVALEDAAEQVELAAIKCRLDLQRMWGEQQAGFTFGLPLCRGLR